MKFRPLALAALLPLACSQKDDIAIYRVPKENASVSATRTSPSGAYGVAWTVPQGWEEQPASGMRAASFRVGSAEVSVVALPGDAGGDLANVNRWRGQLGLGPTDERGLAGQSRRVVSPAGEVLVVDLTAPGKGRMLAARLYADGQSWFFKMTGPEDTVATASPAFDGFLGSLREE